MYARVNPAWRLNHANLATMAMSGSAVRLGHATPGIVAGRNPGWFSGSLSHLTVTMAAALPLIGGPGQPA
eukprot:SAG11_NODE_98_length_16927_cov_35.166211_2_plen_70_part_00